MCSVNASLTGMITTAAHLDREESEYYQLTVVAYDLGSVSKRSTADVQV